MIFLRTHITLLVLILTILLAYTFAITISLGNVPNPGHPLVEIEGMSSGDPSLFDSMQRIVVSLNRLQSTLQAGCATGAIQRVDATTGAVVCETDDTGAGSTPTLDILRVPCTSFGPVPSFHQCTATCPAGYAVLGGGCWDNSEIIEGSKRLNNGWQCFGSAYWQTINGEAICAKLV